MADMKIIDYADPQAIDALITRIADEGWAIIDHFLPDAEVATLREECLRAYQAGGFHVAGIGRGGDFTIKEGIRSDEVMWIDPEQSTPTQSHYWQELSQVQAAVNQQLYMGLHEFEGHFAVYNEGALYKKHLDAFRGNRGRVLTVVFYLNENWAPDDGGELRLYLDEEGVGEHIDVVPLAGRAVVFLSERFWHEVLPACRDRMSITGWFRVRGA